MDALSGVSYAAAPDCFSSTGCGQRESLVGIKGMITRRYEVVIPLLLAGLLSLAAPGTSRGQAVGSGSTLAVASFGAPGNDAVDHIASPFPNPPPPSTTVRIALLDASPSLLRAGQIAALLTRFRRRDLEAHIGMKIELANVSRIRAKPAMGNVVFYRPEFLRAALLIAKAIPGEQSVRPMTPDRLRKSGIDVEIVLGANTVLGEKAP